MTLRTAFRNAFLATAAYFSLTPALAQGVDSCSQVVPDPLAVGGSLTWTGDNSNATFPGDYTPGTLLYNLNVPAVWHGFTITTCADVIIDYCGSPSVFVDFWNVLSTLCPTTNNVVVTQVYNDTTCSDGNPTMRFNNLQPATYLFPVWTAPGTAFGPYQINVQALSCGSEVPPANDRCTDVTPQVLPAGGALTFTGNNTNATSTGDFPQGSPYFAAPVVWHAFTTTVCTDLTLSYCGQDPVWTNSLGFLSSDCPGSTLTFFTTYNDQACGDGNRTYTFIDLPAGTYYLPVLLDANDDAIGPYTVEVSAAACDPTPNFFDLCSAAVADILAVGESVTLTGDNTNATSANDFVPGSPFAGAPVVWHAFTTEECATVTVGYCGLNPAWGAALGFLATDCPADSLVFATTADTTTCGDGNITFVYEELAPGTYLLPVLLDANNGAAGPFGLTMSAAACTPPPPPTYFDLCADAVPDTLAVGGTLILTGDNTNATSTNDFAPGSPLDGTPVVWHSFTTQECATVTVGYCGINPFWTNALGFLATNCPADDLVFFSAFDPSACGDGNLTYVYNELSPGTYLIPVLLDANNNAVGPYTLQVSAAACPGINTPPNDTCNALVAEPLEEGSPLLFSGDNTGATATGDWVSGSPFSLAPVVWHAFSTDSCMDVTVSYCGQVPAWTNALGLLALGCPADSVVYFSTFTDTACGGNQVFSYFQLAAGTYLLPVLLDANNNAVGPYTVTVDGTDCLSTAVGADAQDAPFMLFPEPSDGAVSLRWSGPPATVLVSVMDLMGRTVQTQRRALLPGDVQVLDLSGLAPGGYVLRCASPQGSWQRRLTRR